MLSARYSIPQCFYNCYNDCLFQLNTFTLNSDTWIQWKYRACLQYSRYADKQLSLTLLSENTSKSIRARYVLEFFFSIYWSQMSLEETNKDCSVNDFGLCAKSEIIQAPDQIQDTCQIQSHQPVKCLLEWFLCDLDWTEFLLPDSLWMTEKQYMDLMKYNPNKI